MSQKSILSFFSKQVSKVEKKPAFDSSEESDVSPTKNPPKKIKRNRISSSEDESQSPKRKALSVSPIKVTKKEPSPEKTPEKLKSSKNDRELSCSPIVISEESLPRKSAPTKKTPISKEAKKKATPKSDLKKKSIATAKTTSPDLKKKIKQESSDNDSAIEAETESPEKPPEKTSPKSEKELSVSPIIIKKESAFDSKKTPVTKKTPKSKGSQKKTGDGKNIFSKVTTKSKEKQENSDSEKEEDESSPAKKGKTEETDAPRVLKIQTVGAGQKGADYDPSKKNYHPINDAFWKRGEKVPYLALAKTFATIEDLSGRLRMIEVLSNYLRSVIVLSPDDLVASIYLSLNKLAPAHEGLELGIAETTLMKVIGQSTGRTLAQIKVDAQKLGDLGTIAEQARSTQRMMFQPAPLTVAGVFVKLKEIASMSGMASMSKKSDKIQSIFVACRHSEARYFIRSLMGSLRIGLAELSLLQALGQACTLTPPNQKEYPPKILNATKSLSEAATKSKIDETALILKTTYCQCPNYDKIVEVLLSDGVDELLNKCEMITGTPLKPMLAHPTKGVQEVLQRFDGIKFTCEWKYDGERAQIHIAEDGSISIFSRNQEDNTSKYPDIIARIQKVKNDKVTSCILDCEAVAWDQENKQILPFQVLSTRKRKDANEADIKVQVCVYMFDLLYLNKEPLVTKPFLERRRLLHEHFTEVEGEWKFATSLDTDDVAELQTFLEESVKGNCEGLMIKTLEKDATYEIAKRSRNWLKLKKDYMSGVGDSLDLVVLGGYFGKGKRTGTYGGFLLGCFDSENEEYQSICKLGTGFSDEDLQTHTEFLKKHIIPNPKSYYRFDPSLKPDEWFDAAQVWEIKCADLSLSPIHHAAMGIIDPSKGVSLRFPRFIRIRDDKNVEDATSAQQVADMYMNQDQIKNRQNTNQGAADESYY